MEKDLPPIFIIDILEVRKKINSFATKKERVLFLERFIIQTAIKKAIELWDNDCVSVVNQFNKKQGWRGFFDSLHGTFDLSTAENKEVYLFGKEHYQNYITLCELLDKLNNEKKLPPQQAETKTDKFKAPVLGLFCSLINKIGIDKRDETESATVYCERICNKFKLPYTDRVRQNYNVIETKKLIQEFAEKVLPLIDNETKSLIQKYLDSKQPPKPNLYV